MTTSRLAHPAPALAAGLLALAAVAVLPSGVPLTRDAGFAVRSPEDGAAVGEDLQLVWAPVEGTGRYAVVVDATLPAPGAVAEAGPHVVLVTGTSVRLALGRARTGSPTARGFHTVSVVPLDAKGRRAGADTAVVHVRNRS